MFAPQILHYLLDVHNFSWVLQSFQEKSKTMVMHNVHYGLGENVKWPRSWSLDSWEQINIAVGAWLELWSFGSWVNRNDDLDKLFPVCFPDLATGRERQLTTGKRAERTNTTCGAQFAALQLVKPFVWFARAVVNWRSRSVAKSAYYKDFPPILSSSDWFIGLSTSVMNPFLDLKPLLYVLYLFITAFVDCVTGLSIYDILTILCWWLSCLVASPSPLKIQSVMIPREIR